MSLAALAVFFFAAPAPGAPAKPVSEEDPNRFTGVKEWVGGIQTESYRRIRISGGDCGTDSNGRKVGHPVHETIIRTRGSYDVRLPKDETQTDGYLLWGGDVDSGAAKGTGSFQWTLSETETGCPDSSSRGHGGGSENTSKIGVTLSALIHDDERTYLLIPDFHSVEGELTTRRRVREEDGKGRKRWVTHVDKIDRQGFFWTDGEKSPFPAVPFSVPVFGPSSHNFGTLDLGAFDDDASTLRFLQDPGLKDKVDVPLPKRGMRLTGQAAARDRREEKHEEKTTLDEWRTVTRWQLAPKGKAEFELVVRIDGLDAFIPEGNPEDPTRPGNDLRISAELRDKDGKKAKIEPDEIVFELINSSREPGVCMNRPQPGKADDGYDFRFDVSKNTGHVEDDGQKLTLDDPAKPATLSSYDYGGWTTLAVTAVLPGGYPVYGHLEGDSSTLVQVPRRAEGSRIASAWKKSKGDDAADDDAKPEGDGHAGDGLTAYEEYRGFYSSELGRHVRTDPSKKNYFFVNSVGLGAKSGIGLFRRITGIDTVEMAEGDLCSDADRPNVVNFNATEAPRVTDQHGVILTWDHRGERSSEAVSRRLGPGTPGAIKRIAIGQTFDPDAFKTLTRGGKRITRKTFQRTIAHEMLHSCSVWHHGDRDRRGVAWIVEGAAPDDFISETDIGAAGGTAFGPLRIFNEQGARIDDEVKALIRAKGPLKLYLGNRRGQHSGVEDCVMRYHVADAYDPAEGGSFVRVMTGNGDELPGLGLCDRREGTGVNAPGYPGPFGPRFGNADYDSKRGRCRYQICVNDAYESAHADRISDE